MVAFNFKTILFNLFAVKFISNVLNCFKKTLNINIPISMRKDNYFNSFNISLEQLIISCDIVDL